jgi:hypothetical protein
MITTNHIAIEDFFQFEIKVLEEFLVEKTMEVIFCFDGISLSYFLVGYIHLLKYLNFQINKEKEL